MEHHNIIEIKDSEEDAPVAYDPRLNDLSARVAILETKNYFLEKKVKEMCGEDPSREWGWHGDYVDKDKNH